MNINLEDNYTVAGNRVTVEGETLSTTYTLPKGARRITVERLAHGKRRLILGGFKTVTVTVTGPSKVIDELKEAVL